MRLSAKYMQNMIYKYKNLSKKIYFFKKHANMCSYPNSYVEKVLVQHHCCFFLFLQLVFPSVLPTRQWTGTNKSLLFWNTGILCELFYFSILMDILCLLSYFVEWCVGKFHEGILLKSFLNAPFQGFILDFCFCSLSRRGELEKWIVGNIYEQLNFFCCTLGTIV